MSNSKKTGLLKVVFYGLLGILFLDFLRSKKLENIEDNFKEFLKEEEKELSRFASHKKNLLKISARVFSVFNDYFLPGQHNGHKPKILRAKSLVLITLALFVFKTLFSFYIFFVFPYSAKMSEETVAEILRLVNEVRVSQQLAPLNLDADLSAAASAKAADMVASGYFDHTSPDGRKPWDFISRAQYPYLFVGENLAMNFLSAESAHNALMQSPSHKKNIVNEKYGDIGLAIARGEINGRTTNVLVQMFAAKKTSAPDLVAVLDSKVAGQTAVASLAAAAQETEPVVESIAKPEPVLAVEKPVPAPAVKTEVAAQSYEAPIAPLSADQEASSGPAAIGLLENAQEPPAPEARAIPAPDLPGTELVESFTHFQSLSEKLKSDSPNAALEGGNYRLLRASNIEDAGAVLGQSGYNLADVIIGLALIVLILALLLNIFIRFEFQHKPVIIQSVLAILLIFGLMSVRLDSVSRLLPEINII